MRRFCRAWTPALTFLVVMPWAWSVDRAAATDVWTGYTKPFVKPDGGGYMLPENQDQITPNVHLTRADDHGLFNYPSETSYISTSPKFTEWATATNNLPGAVISATNYAALHYDDWITAYGGCCIGSVVVGQNAVVHLMLDDIYLDLRFTSWTNGHNIPSGGFSYVRAEPPIVTTGDYNGDHVVNAADYALWRDTYGKTVAKGAEADGSANGVIDDPDFTFWKLHFNNPAGAGSGGVAAQSGVPEPATIIVAGLALVTLVSRAAWASWNEKLDGVN